VRKSTVAFTISLAGSILVAPRAEAHFQLVSPKSWWTMASDGSPQKTPPCGNEKTTGTAASGVVTKIQPGQSVPVQVTATIAHPGWYRISLKQGASSTQTMTSLPDPPTLGAAGSAQQCTPAFIDNPVWSPTQPVLADKLGLTAGSTDTNVNQSGTKTFNVTIPSNATCTDASPCTLQVLMFMTDHPSGSCNYHHCADISISTGAGDGGVADASTDARDASGQGGSGMMTTGTAGVGGAGTAGAGAGTAGANGSGTAGVNGSGTGGSSAGSTGTGAAGTTGAGTGGTASSGTGQAGTGSNGTGTGGTSSTGAAAAGGHGGTGSGGSGGGGCSMTASEGRLPRAFGIVLAFALIVLRRRRQSR
jgi:hypothetical protein